MVLVLWGVLTVFPFAWVVINSFKPSAEVLRSSFSLPSPLTMMNYENAFGKLNVLHAYGRSFLISGSVTIGVMVLASLMSFGLTRYSFKGKQIVNSLIVAIFSFLWSYNDLFVQKIMIREPKNFPISTLLEQISSQYGTDFGLMAASVTIIVIPVMIVYVLLQKNIIKGLTAGAVKG